MLKRIIVIASLFYMGCGEAGPPDEVLIPVTGSVRFAGKPTEGITVSFVPKQGTPGTGAFGLTDASGNYSLLHRTQKPGCLLGNTLLSFRDSSSLMVRRFPKTNRPICQAAKKAFRQPGATLLARAPTTQQQ